MLRVFLPDRQVTVCKSCARKPWPGTASILQSFQNPWIWTFCSTKAFLFFLIEG